MRTGVHAARAGATFPMILERVEVALDEADDAERIPTFDGATDLSLEATHETLDIHERPAETCAFEVRRTEGIFTERTRHHRRIRPVRPRDGAALEPLRQTIPHHDESRSHASPSPQH